VPEHQVMVYLGGHVPEHQVMSCIGGHVPEHQVMVYLWRTRGRLPI